jgi:hypothetical protein
MLEQVPQIVGRKNRSGTKKGRKPFCLLPSAFYVVAALRDGVSLQQ